MSSPDALGHSTELAIIGWSGRFPGASSIAEFWQSLREGREGISFFSEQQVLAAGVDPAVARDPSFVRARAILRDVDLFDAHFFGYNPREAEGIDPQQRFFLECAWEALEDAGYSPATYPGRIGVYGSSSMSSYLFSNLISHRDRVDVFQALLGNDRNHLTTRVSYKLNLRGPSVNIQTACSASLVAFHYACQGLLNGECDLGLAGGVSITIPQETGHYYQQGGIYSPDGHCRAFDRRAQGIVGGNGVGIVVVKRLADALADRDTIHAVVKGSAVNNDGAAKVGYTAPGVDGQVAVISEALAVAGVDSETIDYVEAHGTGTSIGDPIEVAALTRVYRASTRKRGFCGIGSVKSNIGHLDAAAGIAGLIKTVLALEHRELPPTLHVTEPNPGIDFPSSPFYVVTEPRPWERHGSPRRSGVSAFGLGGSNAHVILEEAPAPEPPDPSRPWQLLVLSAKTETALETATDKLAEHLERTPTQSLADVAHVLQLGRTAFGHRRALVSRAPADAVAALASRDARRVLTGTATPGARPVAFMFPGVGDHYDGMARGLYESEAVFRRELDACFDRLAPLVGCDLRDVLYPAGAEFESPAPAAETVAAAGRLDLRRMLRRDGAEDDAAIRRLNQTRLIQPIQFAVEYALARLWLAWGVRPAAMIGYSVGEYAAACLAGVLSLDDALFLVARRAELIHALPLGAMLAVPLSEDYLRPLVGDELSIAGLNGPGLCTVAGPPDAVAGLERRLAAHGVSCRRVQVAHAFHSPMMEPIVPAFTELVRSVTLHPPRVPYVSNVSGTWITAAEATDPTYWVRHMCRGVRFADGVGALWADANRILLEVGPGRTLGGLALQHSARSRAAERLVIPSLRQRYERGSDQAFLLEALGKLWLAGVEIDWAGFYADERRRRVPLPTYPFERQRYWVEPARSQPGPERPARAERKPDLADWFYVPSWKRAAPPAAADAGPFAGRRRWLVFVEDRGLGEQLVERLAQEDRDVVAVRVGERFGRLAESIYTCRPERAEDYEALLGELRAAERLPDGIVHLWGAASPPPTDDGIAGFERAQARGFSSLLLLTQALARAVPADPVAIWVVSHGAHDVESGDAARPEQATLLGPVRVAPQEYANLRWGSVDLAPGDRSPVDGLLAELRAGTGAPVVAYRGPHRWVQTFEPVRLPPALGARGGLRERGVYLIVGRLGRVGLALAECLAREARARLVLAGETGLPPREAWDAWLASHPEPDQSRHRIEKLLELEAAGAEILPVEADVADERAMRAVVELASGRFGGLDGVVYAPGTAGLQAVQPIAETDRGSCAWHFRHKAHGLYALERALRGRRVDFCLLVSSLSPILGGLGLLAHASAHLAMDAFAHRQSKAGAPWLAVNWNWADWRDETCQAGWTAQTGVGATVAEFEITPADGVETFKRALALRGVPQLVVSSGDLWARIEQWSTPVATPRRMAPTDGRDRTAPRPTLALYDRPSLPNAYVAPAGSTERRVAALWQELFGIEQIGAHDSFFELGGHSLLGTQLVSKLRQAFRVNLPLRALFEAPTVAGLAEAVDALLAEATAAGPADTAAPVG